MLSVLAENMPTVSAVGVMVALKMVVDGALVLLEVLPVVGGAWGRGAAD